MRILVPFEATRPKTRLDGVLDTDERVAFAQAMLRDVLRACRDAGHDPEVVATAEVDVSAPVAVDDRPLSEAVNARLAATDDPLGIVVADLALLTPAAVDRLVAAAADADLAIAPGRGGGTNGLVVTHPDFRVDFHGVSFRDHLDAAEAVGADVTVVDSMRLSTDVDEPADLVEVLLHGEGEAAAWLRAAGFELDPVDGRVGINRRE
ncbi:2-phospho-L-lactate guanylyltransferase [Haloplanus aerogenes]|uniref:2-phospho-L-lactate guanylyltransferase n=1 Tax=Haloplanus aerogenes TaxID=660522 RepID=A0A3G8QVN7_9EURY|nr:2-phospho-L-lactate guanylyltransferase [Haloplanus aerogenes]AZH26633.1 2-phospho-L-lactate guanylyltransferase [Haloplanus aerogenes]RMB12867.1 2-phospho-L-lactate guanylyltransferase [Haloplanus aerogenes]